ncbi:MAG: hypothetical protein AABY34_00515 [Pseudomonadota bacterium]
MSSFVQLFQSIALIFIIGKDKLLNVSDVVLIERSSDEFKLIIFALFMVIFQVSVGTFFVNAKYAHVLAIHWSDYIVNVIRQFASIAYLFACHWFINEKEQLEIIFKFLVFAGIILSIEFFITFQVPFVRSMLGQYTINSDGRFQSIFLNDIAAVALWFGLASLSSFYFYITQREKKYLIFLLILILATWLSFTRSVLLGLFFAFLFYFYRVKNIKRLRFFIFLACIFLIIVVALIRVGTVREKISYMMPGTLGSRVIGVGSSASTQNRMGQGLRGIQVLSRVIPFGLGPNMEQYYMPINDPSFWGSSDLKIFQTYPFIYEGYARVTTGGTITSIQIELISFVVAYGMLGIIFLIFATIVFLKQTRYILCVHHSKSIGQMGDLIFAIFILYAVYFLYNTTPILYVIFLMMFHALFILSHVEQIEKK